MLAYNVYAEQVQYFSTETTNKEKGVFAFFRLGGNPPDYDYWIKSSKYFNDLPEDEKEKFFIKESLRLGSGYGAFDPDKELLFINTAVMVLYTKPSEDKASRFYFHFPDKDSKFIPTFSYPYGENQWVSLIVNRLAYFADIPLTQEQFNLVSEHLPNNNEEYKAILTIHVRPTKADTSKPIEMRSIKQWIMIGEIAYMKCEVESEKTGNIQKLWDYVAPWYQEEFKILNMREDEKYPHPFDLKK